MNEIWLSIKAWTKGLILASLVLYAAFFVINNSGETVKLWYWFKRDHQSTVFLLTASAFGAGIIFVVLLNTAIKTLRQIRELQSRGRQEKIERDLSEMKAKAAMLQTRPAVGNEGVTIQVDKMGDTSGR